MIIQFAERIADPAGTPLDARFFHDREYTGSPAISGLFTANTIIVYKNNTAQPVELAVENGFKADEYRQYCQNGGQETGVLIKKHREPEFLISLMANVIGHKFIIKERKDETIGIKAAADSSWRIQRTPDAARQASVDYLGIIAAAPSPLTGDDLWLELPRFTASPEFGYEQLGQDLRGDAGQPYGRTVRQLRTISVKFTRVKSDLIDFMYRKVGTTEPHWVVPNPEAVSKMPPIWATLVEPPKFTGRVENGRYYNTQLSWKEAY